MTEPTIKELAQKAIDTCDIMTEEAKLLDAVLENYNPRVLPVDGKDVKLYNEMLKVDDIVRSWLAGTYNYHPEDCIDNSIRGCLL